MQCQGYQWHKTRDQPKLVFLYHLVAILCILVSCRISCHFLYVVIQKLGLVINSFITFDVTDEFKPASIDKTQVGSLQSTKDNRVTVEFHNNQPGKPKVTFEGSQEEYKDSDGVLFFDGESFRLERLHRAVKRLRHVRVPGESAAINLAATTTGMGAESQSPPLPKVSKSQTMSKPVHSVPVSSVTTFMP